MKRVLALALVSLMASSCATAPDKISANYVSPMQYGSYDCSQVREEMLRVAAHVQEVTGVQRRAHTRDQWAVGIGLVVAWPALFFLMEGDKKEELASLKGQYDALNETAIQKHCSAIQEEIAADRAAGERAGYVKPTPASTPPQSAPDAAPAPKSMCRSAVTSPTNPDAVRPTGKGC